MISPASAQVLVNGHPYRTSATNVAELAHELSSAPQRLLIEHNGRALLRAEWATTPIRPGDQFQILTVAAGG